MSTGQWRVFVLLLVLLGMEALRQPNVGLVLSTIFVNPLKQSAAWEV